jgi:hypothetical protein
MNDDQELDLLFGVARATLPDPSARLMARVLEDAYAHQAVPAQVVPAKGSGLRRAWSAMVASLGGSGVVAGLGSAAVAGLFIGYADPVSADWLSNSLLPVSSDSFDLLSAGNLFVTEG